MISKFGFCRKNCIETKVGMAKKHKKTNEFRNSFIYVKAIKIVGREQEKTYSLNIT